MIVVTLTGLSICKKRGRSIFYIARPHIYLFKHTYGSSGVRQALTEMPATLSFNDTQKVLKHFGAYDVSIILETAPLPPSEQVRYKV